VIASFNSTASTVQPDSAVTVILHPGQRGEYLSTALIGGRDPKTGGAKIGLASSIRGRPKRAVGYAMGSADTSAIALIGRDREVQALSEWIDAASAPRGGALLLRGAAGIGKSSLLEAAKAHAAAKRFQILTTTGVQSESRLPFAGLHQLLRPILQHVDRLPESYGKAIRTAFGLNDEAAPSPYVIALSTLHLLSECAESAPLLLLLDDAHWLDHSTAEAMAFVARRLDSDPVVLIPVMRDGFDSPLTNARIPELRVEALGDQDAARLLDAHSPRVPPTLRARILREAAGNPLALVELPIALAAKPDVANASATASLPLTERLELAFADRLSSLTPGTRSLVQVAAIDDRGVLAQLLSAASKLAGHEISLEAASAARVAGLVDIDGDQIRFRHPLMRSAIHQAMSLEERQAAHGALAATLDDDPDRQAWHRAAAVVGKHESIAADLEAVASRAQRRGATSVALQAYERAAQLADAPARRGSRLLNATYQALVLGWHNEVVRLLNGIDDQELDPRDRPGAAWVREMIAQSPRSGSSLISSFFEIADRMRAEGDIPRGVQALDTIAFRCWWSNPDDQTRAHMLEVVERFPLLEDDTRLIYILALTSPVERGAVIIDRVSRYWVNHRHDLGPESQSLGTAAMAVGDFVHAELFMDASISHGRAHGMIGVLPSKLGLLAWVKIQRGDWKHAASLASEAGRLADEIGQTNWTTMANLAAATIAAYRGEISAAETLASAADKVLLPWGANSMLALVQYPRGAAALADGRHEEAYQHLRRIFDPVDSVYHPHIRSWALVDLVEAAVLSGHEDEASTFVRELESVAAQTRSPLLLAALDFARPVLAPDENEAAFQETFGARFATWPFIRARLQLAYGIWLRRQRRAADSRTPLRAARDAFDALGAVPWGERARQELRASGETSRRRTHDLTDALSPQELQIAQLAAGGLSNKEIGQQLFLSHRTVGSHLYRIFPKLGITARSHLAAALQERPAQSSS
jgi:DNA-binding CsgD family transcriptional regulator/tetratricopeptide (TPR) repeat protein